MIFMILCVFISTEPDSLWRVEHKYVVEGLSLLNLSRSDLEYDKQWIQDDFRLQVVSNLMDHPLQVPDYVLASGRALKGMKQMEYYFGFACLQMTGKQFSVTRPKGKDIEELVAGTCQETKIRLDKAFARLTAAERDSLIYTAPTLWADEADSEVRGYAGAVQSEFGVKRDTGFTLELVEVLRLSKKIDITEINGAGAMLARGVQALLPLVKELKKNIGPMRINIEGVEGGIISTFELPGGGRAVIGGPEDNVYRDDFTVIIDLGGNDVYEGRVGGAVGDYGYPVSFVLDLAGDDMYRNNKKLVNQGAGLFGAGMVWDLEGNDTYTAFHISHGAGLYGCGMLVDESGDDDYRAGYFTQGAGNFGSGFMIERNGDDRFQAFTWAQGVGGPRGYGLIADDSGDDTYYTGGVYLHMPLDPDQYRSFSHGFGFGWRDVASGGIGFLYDRSGNDKYIAEVYAQASSYWFALGMLLDEQGNDLYCAAQYSQGAGIHFSVGGLLDLEGDDHYFSRFGPSQGEGHDLGIGWLLDKDGNDVYYASGGQGIGLSNGMGIFVDTRGNDDYGSRESMSQGGVNWARGTGSMGLFVDLQGDDRYAEKNKGANDHVWTYGETALGMDLDAVEPKIEEWEDTTAIFPEMDTMKTDSAKMAQLFHYASLWQVCADIGKVRTGRRMLKQLYGSRAVAHIFNYEFATSDGLVFEAIENIFKEFKDTATVYLYKGLKAENDTVMRNSIYFLGKLEIKEACDSLTKMLEDADNDTLVGPLVQSLGWIKDRKAVPYIIKFQDHRFERTRLRVAVALADIKDTLAIPTLIHQLSDRSLLVRIAAGAGLSQMGMASVRQLLQELGRAKTDPYRALLIKTLVMSYQKLEARDKTADVKKQLASAVKPYVSSEHAALRKHALALIREAEGKGMLAPTELFLND
ncbi:MAG TPA: HEAT repeat domain-containing protein [bacterium]